MERRKDTFASVYCLWQIIILNNAWERTVPNDIGEDERHLLGWNEQLNAEWQCTKIVWDVISDNEVDMVWDDAIIPKPWLKTGVSVDTKNLADCTKPWQMPGWHTICEAHRDKQLKSELVNQMETPKMHFSNYLLLNSVMLPVRAFKAGFTLDYYVPYFASQLTYAVSHYNWMNSLPAFQSTMKQAELEHDTLKEACLRHKHVVTVHVENQENMIETRVSELMQAQNDFHRQILSLMQKMAYYHGESKQKAREDKQSLTSVVDLVKMKKDLQALRSDMSSHICILNANMATMNLAKTVSPQWIIWVMATLENTCPLDDAIRHPPPEPWVYQIPLKDVLIPVAEKISKWKGKGTPTPKTRTLADSVVAPVSTKSKKSKTKNRKKQTGDKKTMEDGIHELKSIP